MHIFKTKLGVSAYCIIYCVLTVIGSYIAWLSFVHSFSF